MPTSQATGKTRRLDVTEWQVLEPGQDPAREPGFWSLQRFEKEKERFRKGLRPPPRACVWWVVALTDLCLEISTLCYVLSSIDKLNW